MMNAGMRTVMITPNNFPIKYMMPEMGVLLISSATPNNRSAGMVNEVDAVRTIRDKNEKDCQAFIKPIAIQY